MAWEPKRGSIDLSPGGESWAGWYLGNYGRAKEWRLHAPTGEAYTAQELAGVRLQALDLSYLQGETRVQAAKLAGAAFHLAPDEVHLVRLAMQAILRELPVQLERREVLRAPKLRAA
jgi:hypothetical protein